MKAGKRYGKFSVACLAGCAAVFLCVCLFYLQSSYFLLPRKMFLFLYIFPYYNIICQNFPAILNNLLKKKLKLYIVKPKMINLAILGYYNDN